MKRMAFHCGMIVVLMVFLAGMGWIFTAVQAAAQETVEQLAIQPEQLKRPAEKPAAEGKVIERKAGDLRRFSRVIGKPTGPKPPPHRDHSWHWHPRHGWVAFPVAIAPPTIILEPTYTLPVRVIAYEAPVVTTESLCPHCGQPLTIQLK